MLGRLVKVVVVLVLLAAAAAGGGYFRLQQWAYKPLVITGEHIVELKPGTSLSGLAGMLAQEGIVSNGAFFHAWVKLNGNYKKFQAGRYRFTGQYMPADVASAMINGEVWNPIVLQVTVPEGWGMKAVAERLAANGVGHIVEINHLLTDKNFLQNLNVPSTSLEGYIYPATYSFHEMPTPEQALTLMVKTFWQNVPKDYEKQVKALGLSLSDAVTFASLIELETRIDDEKPLISEVIWRRLKDKIPLAIDAALPYGIPDYDGDLKWANLSDVSNPYNTRVHLGLPPTPIGSPGVKSLEAVLTPSNFGYYFYVLQPGETRHHFSKTLQEHNEHVKKLVNWTKREKGKGKN